MNTADNEHDLLQLIGNNEPAALRLMYSRYIRHLTAVCSRYIRNDEDAKDVLQESFLKIFGSIDRFVYKGEGSLKAWVTKILVNEALNFISRSGRLDFSPISEENTDIGDDQPETADIPAAIIHDFIRQLPDGYRIVFNLYAIEGKSHREIASMLGIRGSTSASQLHRAKALLASKIREYINRRSS